MKNKNYKLLDNDTITINRFGRDIKLYRIEAIVDIDEETPKGLKGGYIESESNLESYQGEDTAFVYKDAKVFGKKCVVKYKTKLRFGEYFGEYF